MHKLRLVNLEKDWTVIFLSVPKKKSFSSLPFSPTFSLTELSPKFESLNSFFLKPQESQILLQTGSCLERRWPFKTKIYRFHFCATHADSAEEQFLSSLPIHSTYFKKECLTRGLHWLCSLVLSFLYHWKSVSDR